MIDRYNTICDLGWGRKFAPESHTDLVKQGEYMGM